MAKTEAPVKQRKEDRHSSIYSEYAHGLRRRCLRLTGDATAADDLAQEVFARFLARFEDLPADLNVPGYLNTTAHNIWMNQLRKDGHVVVGDLDETLTPDDRIENDPVRRLLLAEQRTDVQRGTAGLPERQRRALALRELDDRSYAEIGAEMGMRTNAVAQVVWRARTQLRRALRRSQVDADLLPLECRARLDAMSDFVDNPSNAGTAELRSHMADCRECRRTLAVYQEAGSGLRGLAPFIPIVAIAARMGSALRAGAEAPLSIGTAAAVTAAVVATAGGGGALVARYTATTSANASAPRTLVRHPSQIVASSATALVIRRASGHDHSSSVSAPPSIPRPHPTRARLPVMRAAAVPDRPPAIPAPKPGSTLPPPKPVPANPPRTIDTPPARTADEDGKPKQETEAKTPPGRAKKTAAAPTQAKTPPGQAKKTAAEQTDSPVTGKLPPGQARKDATTASTPGNAAHGKKRDTGATDATTPTPASDLATPTTGDSAASAPKSHGRSKGTPSSPSTDPSAAAAPPPQPTPADAADAGVPAAPAPPDLQTPSGVADGAPSSNGNGNGNGNGKDHTQK